MNTVIGNILLDVGYLLTTEPFTYFVGLAIVAYLFSILLGFFQPVRKY